MARGKRCPRDAPARRSPSRINRWPKASLQRRVRGAPRFPDTGAGTARRIGPVARANRSRGTSRAGRSQSSMRVGWRSRYSGGRLCGSIGSYSSGTDRDRAPSSCAGGECRCGKKGQAGAAAHTKIIRCARVSRLGRNPDSSSTSPRLSAPHLLHVHPFWQRSSRGCRDFCRILCKRLLTGAINIHTSPSLSLAGCE